MASEINEPATVWRWHNWGKEKWAVNEARSSLAGSCLVPNQINCFFYLTLSLKALLNNAVYFSSLLCYLNELIGTMHNELFISKWSLYFSLLWTYWLVTLFFVVASLDNCMKLESKQSRVQWEDAYVKTYILPALNVSDICNSNFMHSDFAITVFIIFSIVCGLSLCLWISLLLIVESGRC